MLTNLGLGQEVYNVVCSTITLIIYSVWAVNFTLGVSSFEAQYNLALYHLLDLCLLLSFSRPARLAFISSVFVAAGMSGPVMISETLVKDLLYKQNTGYV